MKLRTAAELSRGNFAIAIPGLKHPETAEQVTLPVKDVQYCDSEWHIQTTGAEIILANDTDKVWSVEVA